MVACQKKIDSLIPSEKSSPRPDAIYSQARLLNNEVNIDSSQAVLNGTQPTILTFVIQNTSSNNGNIIIDIEGSYISYQNSSSCKINEKQPLNSSASCTLKILVSPTLAGVYPIDIIVKDFQTVSNIAGKTHLFAYQVNMNDEISNNSLCKEGSHLES